MFDNNWCQKWDTLQLCKYNSLMLQQETDIVYNRRAYDRWYIYQWMSMYVDVGARVYKCA